MPDRGPMPEYPPIPAAPTASSAAVRSTMQGNRKTGTRPEVELRRHLHRLGFRFRKNLRLEVDGLAVAPDIVFPRARVAVFVDGCFWHGCPEHFRPPRTNVEYWEAKIGRNKARDAAVDGALGAAGWEVVRVWEHRAPENAAAEVLERLPA